ncbi:MAG: alpha/beta hydrolase [Bacteroidota bacterium]
MIYLFIVFTVILLVIGQFQANISADEIRKKFTDERSRFFQWQGVEVHFKDEGNGIPILFLHGTSSSLHTWDDISDILKANHRIIRLDLIGSGITGPHPQREYSIDMYLTLIEDFATFLGLDEFVIAGNSSGAMWAWNYAALYPNKVSGLILMNSAGFNMQKVPLRFRLVQYRLGRWLLKHSTPIWMVKKGLSEVLYSKKPDRKSLERYQQLMLREGNRQAFVDVILNRQAANTALLSAIQAPTLLLWGRHDQLYPLSQAYLFQAQIPKARVEVLEQSAHIPMEEEPFTCSAQIQLFIHTLQHSRYAIH